jgi:hypothetical protein
MSYTWDLLSFCKNPFSNWLRAENKKDASSMTFIKMFIANFTDDKVCSPLDYRHTETRKLSVGFPILWASNGFH